MAFLQKTWKDRVAEYINRRVLTKEDGTTELVSVERSEGTISQEGDAFSAANMNDLEQRIANEFSEQNKNLGGLIFGKDGDGNVGYYGADGSLIPFKSGLEEIEIWSRSASNFSAQTVSIDLSEYTFISVVARASMAHGEDVSLPQLLKIGESGRLSASTAATSFLRSVSCDVTGVTFGDGYWETSKDNGYCIPIKIYGYK